VTLNSWRVAQNYVCALKKSSHVIPVLGLAGPLLTRVKVRFSLFSKLFLLLRTILYDLRPVMPEKYCSKCPRKLDFSFFVKDQSVLYTPTARIYSICYICRDKDPRKRKRQATVSTPSLHPLPQIPIALPRLVTPVLGPLLHPTAPTAISDPPPPPPPPSFFGP
jgi:hypothetical protein